MRNHIHRHLIVLVAAFCSACAGGPEGSDNPLLVASDLPMQYPPFDRIEDSDFGPAFDRGMTEQLAEIEAIANSPEAPDFYNTIVAMERSGRNLDRARTVFFNLVAADTNDTRQALNAEYSPKLAAHSDAIWLNDALYARVKAVYEARHASGLNAEAVRLIERYHKRFVRSGAGLAPEKTARLREINTELASLQTSFSQKVLAEVNDSAIVIDDVNQLRGLPAAQIEAAAEAARARGMDGKWVLALLNTTGQPPLAYLEDRALRQRIHEASTSRGSRGNENDTRGIICRTAKLRAERARILGYPTHAAYVLADQTAETAEAVNARLAQLGPPAVANARREAQDIQRMIDREGGGFQAAAWDWDYYTEKVRKERFDFDEAALKPYLAFERVLEDGVFYAAERLFGITFKERNDLPVYHPTVRVYDVTDHDGKPLAIFLLDPYARPSKRGGAWMTSYVSQSHLLDEMPVVANHLNIPEPPKGAPALMTWDEVVTLFHEFGHALHGMFSNVTYPYFSGTAVPRDYVEFPSQVNEMWASWPEILANYARHHETGEAMPPELVQKVIDASKFNQGFRTTEYLAASMLDQRLHQLGPEEVPTAEELLAFEAAMLGKDGIDFALVPPRYRLTYFSHIMGGYSSGYYAYIWSEVMDADSVEWMKENGGLLRKNGDRFRDAILSRGGSVEAMQMFRDFRGRDPDITPLLLRRGLNAR